MAANEHTISSKCFVISPLQSECLFSLTTSNDPFWIQDLACPRNPTTRLRSKNLSRNIGKNHRRRYGWRAVARFGHVPYVGQLHSSPPLTSLDVGGRSSWAQQHTQSILVCCGGKICGLSGSKNKRHYTDILAPCTQGRGYRGSVYLL